MLVLGDIPRLNAKRFPEKKSLIMERDYLTFDSLNQLTNKLSVGLLSIGVQPGDRVAIISENRIEYAIINYAVAKCGAILVPINFRYKKHELVGVINNSKPKVLFFDRTYAFLVEEAEAEITDPVHMVSMSNDPSESKATLSSLIEGNSSSEPPVSVNPEWPALLVYTSGTTGRPKGVLHSHSTCLHSYFTIAIEGDVGRDERVLLPIPLFHQGGLNMLLQPFLMTGNTVVIMGRGFDPEKLLDALKRYRITTAHFVPTQIAMIVRTPELRKYNYSSLKKVWYGSSSISPDILDAARGLFNADFYQWYGSTETFTISLLRPEDHVEHSQFTGRRVFNVDFRVVDENGKDTPLGEIGEIISAQKPQGMLGYYELEESTRETIRDGWIHTGDLARVEKNGYITVTGRSKDIIISGGENIYPKEIEDVIISHPDVGDVAVIRYPR